MGNLIIYGMSSPRSHSHVCLVFPWAHCLCQAESQSTDRFTELFFSLKKRGMQWARIRMVSKNIRLHRLKAKVTMTVNQLKTSQGAFRFNDFLMSLQQTISGAFTILKTNDDRLHIILICIIYI